MNIKGIAKDIEKALSEVTQEQIDNALCKCGCNEYYFTMEGKMDKCCDNCNLDDSCGRLSDVMGTPVDNWDTSKDYCSKWEEKEADRLIKDVKIVFNGATTTKEIIQYFKQRIEESIEQLDPDTIYDEIRHDDIKKAFKWILDDRK